MQYLVPSSKGGRRCRPSGPSTTSTRLSTAPQSPRGFRRLVAAGLRALPVDDPADVRHRRRHRRARPLARGVAPDLGRHGHHDGQPGDDPARLPRRHRRLRLLVRLRDRSADEARGPLRPRGEALERLLPRQHRPQGDRRPVRLHDVRLLHRRRSDGARLPRRAGEARDAVRRHADVQRPRVGARDADDLPVHHPRLRGSRELRDPVDARRARHGVPAAERALLLAAADRRGHVRGEHGRPRRAVRDRAGRATRRWRATSR